MNFIEHLATCAGDWRGSSRLQDPSANLSEESPSTLTVVPVLGGRFVRLDYTWGYKGRPQAGSMLIGYNPTTTTDSVFWIDTWHTGHDVMALSGPSGASTRLSVLGSYAAPPGPDWGWRVTLDLSSPRSLGVVMHNIWPEGKEEVAVDALYANI